LSAPSSAEDVEEIIRQLDESQLPLGGNDRGPASSSDSHRKEHRRVLEEIDQLRKELRRR